MGELSVLLVEDEPEVATDILGTLQANGWDCRHTATADEAVRLATSTMFDVLVIDRMLADGDGLDALRRIRRQGIMVPALVLSALGEPQQKIEGLEGGADDYMSKPYSSAELVARIQVLLRRATYREEVIREGKLETLAKSRTAHYADRHLDLSGREFDLLLYLARNRGIAVSREMIRQHVFKLNFDPGTNIVEVHIFRLREEIKKKSGQIGIINTVRNAGYRLG